MPDLSLHVPSSRAHLEDLSSRLASAAAQAAPRPHDALEALSVAVALTEVVRAMDLGALTLAEAAQVFAAFNLPGFRFERWVDEMIEEGIYLPPQPLAA